jgi:hypothetical protein
MYLDMQTIKILAWGSALTIIPVKIFFLVRFIKKKMAIDEIKAAKQLSGLKAINTDVATK